MDLDLGGKVAFVAGSSRGIGFAVAAAFLEEGARVTITGRVETALKKAAALLSEKHGPGRVMSFHGDMTREDDVRMALDQTFSSLGGLDAVIANVGSGTQPGGWNLSSDDWRSSLEANLLGSMMLAREALHHLTNQKSGSLTFISSIAGFESISAPIAYSAAKSGLLSSMKSLSRLVGPHGVRVNAVAPGNVLFAGGTWERKLQERREFFEDYVRQEVPLQRFGTPEEIADAVLFLSSKRAAFITGSCVVVDGGQTRSI